MNLNERGRWKLERGIFLAVKEACMAYVYFHLLNALKGESLTSVESEIKALKAEPFTAVESEIQAFKRRIFDSCGF